MVYEKFVLVFDICSSTVMMEDAQKTSSLNEYFQMIDEIREILELSSAYYRFSIYKFQGDGFIILVDPNQTVENIILLSTTIIKKGNDIINGFILRYMETKNIPRIGITIGVDKGILLEKDNEYIGRSINIACRIQGKLDSVEDVNKIILTQKVFNQITDENLRILFKNMPKTLRNVNNGQPFSCYEANLLFFDGLNIELITKSINKEALIKKLGKYSIGSPKYEYYLDKNGAYRFRLKDRDGQIIMVSEGFNSKSNCLDAIKQIKEEMAQYEVEI